MCTSTEPVGTGIGAVCVKRGRPKRPVTMLNHTHALTEKKKKVTLHARKTRFEEAFFCLENQEKRARALRFARLFMTASWATECDGYGLCMNIGIFFEGEYEFTAALDYVSTWYFVLRRTPLCAVLYFILQWNQVPPEVMKC